MKRILIKIFRSMVLSWFYPVIKKIGKIHMPWTHKKITEQMVRDLLPKIQAGDVIMTYKAGELTNLLIPGGEYKHCGIWTGVHMIEAVDPESRMIGIFQFLMTKDKAIVVRRKRLNPWERHRTGTMAEQFLLGKPYDYQFMLPDSADAPNKNSYCFELAYRAHQMVDDTGLCLREVWGVKTVVADDFLCPNEWKVITEIGG